MFNRAKAGEFSGSVDGIYELVELLQHYSFEQNPEGVKALKFLSKESAEASLWGNATDLPLLFNLKVEDFKSPRGREARLKAEKKIFVNNNVNSFRQLISVHKGDRRVNAVLVNNSGFELFSDLIFAQLVLHDVGLCDLIVLHISTMDGIRWYLM